LTWTIYLNDLNDLSDSFEIGKAGNRKCKYIKRYIKRFIK